MLRFQLTGISFCGRKTDRLEATCVIQARFTRQLFWHGTRLNLAQVPKIVGPAPFIFVV